MHARSRAVCAATAFIVTVSVVGCGKNKPAEPPANPVERPADLKLEKGGGAAKPEKDGGRTKGGELNKPVDPRN